MQLRWIFFSLLCIPGALAGCTETVGGTGNSAYGIQYPPPSFSSPGKDCSIYQWMKSRSGSCAATTVETQPVQETVRSTWIEACKKYLTEPGMFDDISVEHYVEGGWNSLWNRTMDGTSGAGCSFEFKVISMPGSAALYIGSEDLSDIAHDMPAWAGPNNHSVGGTMTCQVIPNLNHGAQIKWRIIPLQPEI
ncbi:hypothetical protein F5X96DRAFT_644611 [Biscogniauxia mediterranea]|nr:hypothetical protein F5X96DRAFT_644611 [Biscogniauxia mediterranea]